MTNQSNAMDMLNCSVNGQNIVGTTTSGSTGLTSGTGTGGFTDFGQQGTSLWGYWQNCYYPYVIRESYPLYIQERAMDKGKQAFELLKVLMDKKLLKVEKVSDFIEAMDAILKTL